MKLRWMPQALRDIDAIRRHIARDNPAAAREWLGKLQSRARTAATAPWAGRVVPEADLPEVREVFVRTYRIVYRVRGDELQVLTVFEGHQLLQMDVVSGGAGSKG